ncbi:D-alanyl-D-alanine carboxypeptidase/D-alanyl-D-alanine endopeptidase [Dokdonella immobilis]|uniref:D-alanyl-D-alanine carboxypeptidase/D-alanyl-D-alanine endopeptidase n=1 Tax=Dokdonella immobilis TaxID=578942 RepID=UPI001587F0C8|nr:D-alanyl-D-alanine carboxypeptidase/D-alanyl-D-alanine-endopeptidase [Dokdonella immobilis]
MHDRLVAASWPGRTAGVAALVVAVLLLGMARSQAAEGATLDSSKNAKSLATLAARIDAHIGDPQFADASWGIDVVSLDSGKTLYAHDADKLFVPASTGKLYTAALALDTFGPDYRIPTSLFATEKAGRDGELRGDLILVGYGDPTLGFDKRASWADVLATAVRKSGIKSVRGALIGDATWFAAPLYGSGWEAADLQSWFGAPVSALSVDENVVRVEVRPAPQFGAKARILFDPPGSAPTLDNQLRTLRAPAPTDISLYRAPGEHVLHAFGTIASNAGPQFYRLAVHDPALIAVEQLRAALARQGVSVQGKSRSIYWPESNDRLASGSLERVADVWSPPLSEIVSRGLKVSQNLYLQNLLLMVGAKTAAEERLAGKESPAFRSTEARGIQALRNYLRRIDVPLDGVLMEDGPGLSRRDLTSAAALTALLAHLGDNPAARAFRLGLPEAGVDGSLTGRMRNSAAQGRIHAKTGSMAFTYALAGYALTAANERLAFAIMLNNYRRPRDAGRPTAELDAIAIMLAELSERSAP